MKGNENKCFLTLSAILWSLNNYKDINVLHAKFPSHFWTYSNNSQSYYAISSKIQNVLQRVGTFKGQLFPTGVKCCTDNETYLVQSFTQSLPNHQNTWKDLRIEVWSVFLLDLKKSAWGMYQLKRNHHSRKQFYLDYVNVFNKSGI